MMYIPMEIYNLSRTETNVQKYLEIPSRKDIETQHFNLFLLHKHFKTYGNTGYTLELHVFFYRSPAR